MQAYLKKNKLGKYNEEEMAALAKEKEENELKDEQKTGGWLSWWRKSDAPGDVKEEHDGDAALLQPVEEAPRTDVATQTDLGWPISLR